MTPTRRAGNPLVRDARGARRLNRLQRPWFAVLPPKGYGVITTTGRITGQPHAMCIRVARQGSTVYLTAIKGGRPDWIRNIEANPEVTIRIRGGRLAGKARLLQPGYHEHEGAIPAYARPVPFDYVTYAMHARGRPRRARVAELLRDWFIDGTPVAVDLSNVPDTTTAARND